MAALPSACPPAYVPYAAQAALPPGYSNLLPPAQPCRQLSPNPPPEDLPWWSIPQAAAPPGCAHRFPAAAALPRGLVLGHSDFAQYQTQIAALLQTKSPLAATARRCRRCRCPNCQAAAGSAPEAEPGKKKQHVCHIPGCGKVRQTMKERCIVDKIAVLICEQESAEAKQLFRLLEEQLLMKASQKLAIGDNEDDEEKSHESSNMSIKTNNYQNSSEEKDEESYDSEEN
ncbi:UNVERIFIED_CONTAM: hypothetical protein H355_009546 [Colinus virginianus]|nr:hypothetical protein H355_009546 [Colinus virginianus]